MTVSSELQFTITPKPPFDLDLISLVLRRAPANIIDRFNGGCHTRLLDLGSGQLALAQLRQTRYGDEPELLVRLKGNFTDAVAARQEAIQQLDRLFGLNVDLTEFFTISRLNERLAPLPKQLSGLKPQRYPTLFEAALNCICCQQVSLQSGLSTLSRIAQAFGPRLTIDGQTYYSLPRPETIAALDPAALRCLGMSRRKGEYIVGIARAMAEGHMDEAKLEKNSTSQLIETLATIRGFGRWSVHYMLLRGFGRLDIFPVDDVGASRSLAAWLNHDDQRLPAWRVDEIVSSWDPYRGMLYFYLVAWKRLAAAGQWPYRSH